jgi:hypothetical protein
MLLSYFWILPLLTFIMPLWRLMFYKGRYSDPFWALCFLGSLNRLSTPSPGLYPVVLALLLTGFSIYYQRLESDAAP